MGLLSKFFNNARKPAGFLGKMMVNAQAIRESRCKAVEGSVAELPFGKDTFDMVTAFETIYFWPDIEHCFNEVKRVLKNGGVFAIVNEDDGLSGTNERWEKIIDGMHTYTPQEIRLHLTNTGFRGINVERNETKHWLMATAKK